MGEGHIRRDPAGPRLEGSLRIETVSGFVHPPECLNRDILGQRSLADDPNDPPVDPFHVLTEEGLERVDVPAGEPLEQVQVTPRRIGPSCSHPHARYCDNA